MKKGRPPTKRVGNEKLYRVHADMKCRCNSQNHPAYGNYGGRGISYTPEWESFAAFFEWAKGDYQEGLWLDRIDNNSGYSPDNCRWTDVRTQMRNRQTKSKYGPCIYQCVGSSRYHIRVYANGKLHNLGTYDTVELCELVRDEFLEGVAA